VPLESGHGIILEGPPWVFSIRALIERSQENVADFKEEIFQNF
jgi:hypothetical protein